ASPAVSPGCSTSGGSLSLGAHPRCPVPGAFIAAGITYSAHPANSQTAPPTTQGGGCTGNITHCLPRSGTAADLSAFTAPLSALRRAGPSGEAPGLRDRV